MIEMFFSILFTIKNLELIYTSTIIYSLKYGKYVYVEKSGDV